MTYAEIYQSELDSLTSVSWKVFLSYLNGLTVSMANIERRYLEISNKIKYKPHIPSISGMISN